MRILFVAPPIRTASVGLPIGLAYLAAVARRAGAEARILDFAARRAGPRALDEALRAFRPDWVGLTLSTLSLASSRPLIEAVRAARPDAKLIAGGPLVSAMPEFALAHTGADLGVAGEGEEALEALIRSASAEDAADARQAGGSEAIPGVVRWVEGRPTHDGARAAVADLDSLPLPAWDLVRPDRYPAVPRTYLVRRYPVCSILTSRGCPYGCTFCASHKVFGKRHRPRDPRSVCDEIEWLAKDFGIREIHFEDDNLLHDRDHVVGLCEEMLRRRLDLPWKDPNGVRIDRLDADLMRLMRRAGCYQLLLGIESATQEIVDRAAKGFRLEECEGRIREARALGFEVLGLFMLGLPGETEDTARRQISYARSDLFDLAHFSIFVPIPGSALFDALYPTRAEREAIDWKGIQFFRPERSAGSLPPLRLKRIQRRAILSFYLRPRTLAFLARRMKPRLLPGVVKALWRYAR